MQKKLFKLEVSKIPKIMMNFTNIRYNYFNIGRMLAVKQQLSSVCCEEIKMLATFISELFEKMCCNRVNIDNAPLMRPGEYHHARWMEKVHL